ncbi:hypothetical protein JCGZ_06822 [Jatropha curcas]|uniref:Cytochrome P450 n=1 Tax=Jatropha curcas TaxID=180498 RepID=A0A067KQV1_JATCU|nr:hypothetical protein JCGZ_06822 [Jatropha curcas]
MAKDFLKTHEIYFLDCPKVAAVDYLTYGSAYFAFTPCGPHWKAMKKICMTELLGGRMLDQLFPVRREEIAQFLLTILTKANAGESFVVGRQLLRLTNNVISRITMSERCSDNEDEANEVRELVRDVFEVAGKFNLSDYIWFCKNVDLQGFRRRVEKVSEKLDKMMQRIIAEHEEARKINKERGEGDSVKGLLDILLNISEDENSEMKWTKEKHQVIYPGNVSFP